MTSTDAYGSFSTGPSKEHAEPVLLAWKRTSLTVLAAP
jgi:hypothetical protein